MYVWTLSILCGIIAIQSYSCYAAEECTNLIIEDDSKNITCDNTTCWITCKHGYELDGPEMLSRPCSNKPTSTTIATISSTASPTNDTSTASPTYDNSTTNSVTNTSNGRLTTATFSTTTTRRPGSGEWNETHIISGLGDCVPIVTYPSTTLNPTTAATVKEPVDETIDYVNREDFLIAVSVLGGLLFIVIVAFVGFAWWITRKQNGISKQNKYKQKILHSNERRENIDIPTMTGLRTHRPNDNHQRFNGGGPHPNPDFMSSFDFGNGTHQNDTMSRDRQIAEQPLYVEPEDYLREPEDEYDEHIP